MTGVCGTSKVDLVRSLGADDVIDYSREEIDRGGPQYDVVIDTAGNRPLSLLRRATTAGGTIALVGGGHAKGRWLGGFQRQLAAPALSLRSGRRICGVTARERHEDLDELIPMLESGSITPVIDREYRLAAVPAAMRHLAEGHPTGKIVVTVTE
ncbi:zinc-binding dehydrogenase [Actinoplanes sp. NPDC026619]|uniref:zinc-binding dehydrogenase n=1 Tax=Actinoplanes sp. NPDC026619 TaxID=3155798 RepID=UPI0033FCF203